MKYNYTRNRSDYLTSPELLKEVWDFLDDCNTWNEDERPLKFDLDTCCTLEYIPANEYYKEGEKNGLIEPWRNLNYCNPPFNEAGKWVKKAFQEKQRGRTTALLIPARTETAYFQDYILNQWFDGVFVKFLRKGYGFLNPDTFEPMGVYKNALAIVVMRGNEEN